MSRGKTHRIEYRLSPGEPLRLWVRCEDEVDGIPAETSARLLMSYLRHQEDKPEAIVYLDGVGLPCYVGIRRVRFAEYAVR